MNIKVISKWLLRLTVAIILLQTLPFKFGAHPDSVKLFSELGIEPWGRIGTGILELIAAILILIPKTSIYGALLTVGLMLAGVHAVGKTACFNLSHTLPFNTIACAIALAVAAILFAKHINPVVLMLLGGVAGWFFLRGG